MKETKKTVKGWVVMGKDGSFTFVSRPPDCQVYTHENGKSSLLEESYVLPCELSISFPDFSEPHPTTPTHLT